MTTLSPEELTKVIGARLLECRKERQWPLADVAARIAALTGDEVPASRYSNWELGLRRPPLWMALALAELFEVEEERFLDARSAEWAFLSARLMVSKD